MSYLIRIVVLIVALGFMIPAGAVDKPNLLIVGEDVNNETIPRNSRVFRRVVDALSNQMSAQGFEVYDQSAVSLGKFDLQRDTMGEGEIIELARSVSKPPIDIVVMFAIYADVESKGYTTQLKTRIEGRMLNVNSNKKLDSFEVESPKPWNVNSRCNRECIINSVGDHAKTLANDLGYGLAKKLDAAFGGMISEDKPTAAVSGYTLEFDNFSSADMHDIEEYLVIFSGYKSHRPITSSATGSELWYKSSIESGKLERNLEKMLSHLEIEGAVSYSGNSYKIKQLVNPQKKRELKSLDWE